MHGFRSLAIWQSAGFGLGCMLLCQIPCPPSAPALFPLERLDIRGEVIDPHLDDARRPGIQRPEEVAPDRHFPRAVSGHPELSRDRLLDIDLRKLAAVAYGDLGQIGGSFL